MVSEPRIKDGNNQKIRYSQIWWQDQLSHLEGPNDGHSDTEWIAKKLLVACKDQLWLVLTLSLLLFLMIFSIVCIICGWITWGRKSCAIHLLLLSSIIPWTYVVLNSLNSPSGLRPTGHYPTGFFGGFRCWRFFGPKWRLLGISWNGPKNRYVASLFTVRGSLVILELPGLFIFRQFFEHYYGFYCWFIGEFMVDIHVSELHYYLRASSPLSKNILKLHLHQVASSPIFFYTKYYSLFS